MPLQRLIDAIVPRSERVKRQGAVEPVHIAIFSGLIPALDNTHRRFGETDVQSLARQILAPLKPIRLKIAHFGTSGGFNARTKAVIEAFITELGSNKALSKHKILFDISAVALDKDSEGVPKLTDEQFKELAAMIRKLGTRRIVFGTDYPLYSVSEYLKILRTRVVLTETEINEILAN